jgi:hypothetical protein
MHTKKVIVHILTSKLRTYQLPLLLLGAGAGLE